MSEDSSAAGLLDELADEFVNRQQAGELPSVSEYCERYPELAEEIRDLFATLAMLEGAKPRSETQIDPVEGAPARIKHYQILGEIGRGGMGVVYEALDQTLGRRVALKVLPRQSSIDTKALARFRREGRAIANLHHTNIVPLFEVGNDGGRFFLAMQLIAGRSLDRVLADATAGMSGRTLAEQPHKTVVISPSTVEKSEVESPPLHPAAGSSTSHSERREAYVSVARIGVQVAQALAHAHARGVIHRDVKPGNILLDENREVWLTDFGLAKTDDDGLTGTGDFVGTLRYMAPERFRGQCDERADVYGLGLTLYELLTLRQPFQSADRLKLLKEIAESDPLSPRSVDPGIPRDLETIVLRAIHKDAAARYPTASELAEDLSRFMEDRPIRARRHSLWEQTVRWARRNRGLAAALAGVAALLIAIIVVLVVMTARENHLRLVAERSESDAKSAQARAEESGNDAAAALKRSLESERNERVAREAAQNDRKRLEDALELAKDRDNELKRTLYYSEVNLAGQTLGTSSGTQQLMDIVEGWKSRFDSGDAPVDFRGWEWYYLRSVSLEDVASIDGVALRSADWNADGSRVALITIGGGRWQSTIAIHDASSGELVQTLKGHSDNVRYAAWDTVHDRIASASMDRTIRLWDPATGECLRTFGPFEHEACYVAWNESGTQLAFMSSDVEGVAHGHVVRIINVDDPREEPITLATTEIDLSHRLSWSVDGERIAGGGSREMVIWDLGTREIVSTPMEANGVVWEPAGHGVAGYFVCEESGDIHLVSPTGRDRLRTFRGLTAQATLPVVSRDRKMVLAGSADKTVRIWDLESADPIRVFQRHQSNVAVIAPDPVGNRVISGAYDPPQVLIWPLWASVLTTLENPLITDMEWSPDGQMLAVASDDDQLRVWEVAREAPRYRAAGTYRCCGWSADGRLLAFGGDRLRFWSVGTEDPAEIAPHGQEIHDLDWHPTKPWILYCADSKVFVYEVDTGATMTVTTVHGHSFRAAAWHPHEPNVIAFQYENQINIWDIKEVKPLRTLEGHTGRPVSLAWSPEGSLLASAADDGTARVWNFATGEEVLQLRNHNNTVNGAHFSPDGRRLATCGNDGTVRIWDAATGLEAMTLRDVGSGVAAVRWSPDGRRISAGGPNGKLVVWDATAAYRAEAAWVQRVQDGPVADDDVWKAPKPAATVSNAAKVLLSPEWKWTEFENLGPAINSPHGEFEPSLSADGLTLLFHSDRPGGHGGYDIWMSVRESPNQPWRPATNLGPIVNSDANDEGPELSHDGLTLYFSSNRRDGDIDLWCTTRDSVAEPWREPELVRGVNSWRTEVEPALSSDGLTLVFASTRDPSLGVFDLWMCRRDATDDDWSKPSHLSASINADQWQGSPSLSSDEWGSIMVFHSYDQLKISIRDSNESRFTTMYNLSDDGRFDFAFSPCLSPDGKSLYFRSTNEDGDFDLWVTRRVKR